MPSFSFKKSERLCSRPVIDDLFVSSEKLMVFPLSVRWKCYESGYLPSDVQVLLTAPKKKLHHAVDRNRTRRLMRECFRLRKEQLRETVSGQKTCMAISISYIHNEVPDYATLSERFDKVMLQLIQRLQESEENSMSQTQTDLL